jgi:hypothetical protein
MEVEGEGNALEGSNETSIESSSVQTEKRSKGNGKGKEVSAAQVHHVNLVDRTL